MVVLNVRKQQQKEKPSLFLHFVKYKYIHAADIVKLVCTFNNELFVKILRKLLDPRVEGKFTVCNSKFRYGKAFLYSPMNFISVDDVKRERK